MKKNVLFCMLVGGMLSISSTVSAQEPYPYTDYRTFTIYSTTDYITADGIEDEACWSAPGVTEQPIDRILHEWSAEPAVNTWNYAATFKAVYDDAYLYLFVKVTDNSDVPYNAELMKGSTAVDNVEVFFFPNPSDRNLVDPAIPDRRQSGLSQIRAWRGNTDNLYTGGGYVNQFAVDAGTGRPSDRVISGYEYKSHNTATGYNMEIVIPWDIVISDAFVSNLEVGKTILFDINPANVTAYDPGTREIILGWSTDDFHSWKANFKMGEMTFGGIHSSTETISLSNISYTFSEGVLTLSNVEGTPQVDIYDLFGRSVKSLAYSGSAINLSAAASGVYIVNVAGSGSFKIVK